MSLILQQGIYSTMKYFTFRSCLFLFSIVNKNNNPNISRVMLIAGAAKNYIDAPPPSYDSVVGDTKKTPTAPMEHY